MSHIRSSKSKLFARIGALRQKIDEVDAAVERDASSLEILQHVEIARRELGGLTADVVEDEVLPMMARRRAAFDTMKPERRPRFVDLLRKYLR